MSGKQHWQFFDLVKQYRRRLLLGCLVMLITVGGQLFYPKALSYFIDNVDQQPDQQWYSYFALVMLVVFVIQAVAAASRYYLFESAGHMMVTQVRRRLHKALVKKHIGFYDKHSVGELVSRLSSDVEVIQDTLTMGLAIAVRSALVVLGGVVMMLVVSPTLSLMLLFFIPITTLLGKWIGDGIQKRSMLVQEHKAQCGKVAQENFANIRQIHAFNRQEMAEKHYFDSSEKALGASLSSTRFLAGFNGAYSLATYFSLLIVFFFGARLIFSNELTVGELTGFIIYAGMVTMSADAISGFWGEWMSTMGATKKVFQLINDAEAGSGTKGESTLQLQGSIRFKDVCFSYPERREQQALKACNFSIVSGEKLAVVGSSGAGKSTISNLILGFYRPDSGQITFDQWQAHEQEPGAIRDNIAVVEQEPVLFSGSIYDNIAFGATHEQVSLEQVQQAAKLAHAHDFISQFSKGYDAVVGDRGVQLSGGQKQRIAIARALIRDPKILILDEATSALDPTSELLVQTALDNLMHGRTTIIIAHRYSSIAKADRVLVLERGAVVQQGKHQELLQQEQGLFYQLMAEQALQSQTA